MTGRAILFVVLLVAVGWAVVLVAALPPSSVFLFAFGVGAVVCDGWWSPALVGALVGVVGAFLPPVLGFTLHDLRGSSMSPSEVIGFLGWLTVFSAAAAAVGVALRGWAASLFALRR